MLNFTLFGIQGWHFGGSGVDSHYNNKMYVKYLATKRPLNILNQSMPHLIHHMHPQQIQQAVEQMT